MSFFLQIEPVPFEGSYTVAAYSTKLLGI